MKKLFSLAFAMLYVGICCFGIGSCNNKERVMIYTSSEDYTIEYLEQCFNEKFPDIDIHVEYLGTSNIAAKLVNEGLSSDCDIVFAQEYGYIVQLMQAGVLADLSKMYDYSVFTEESLDTEAKNYLLPALKTGGAVVVNNAVLKSKGLEKPTRYEDLLDSKYDNLISMPSPKSSGTGYMFYLSLVNEWGETNALDYFNKLTDNILAYTSSGSVPINKLIWGEVAVGFGMISQAVDAISEGSKDLEILFFEEGAPFNLYGNCIVKGKETNEKVKQVMDYLYSEFTNLCAAKYYPEALLKNKNYTTENYPSNIRYSNMKNNTLETKQRLLEKWKH